MDAIMQMANYLVLGAGITDAIGDIIDFIMPIGWGLATLGLIGWGVTKMAAPILPEVAQQFQGTISKIAVGALILGLAPTIINVLMGAFS
jgi:hypothetical protein